jgi:hypothetical protein
MLELHLNASSITILHVVQLFVQSLQDLVVCHLNSLISHTSILNPFLDPFAHRLDQKARVRSNRDRAQRVVLTRNPADDVEC